MNCCGLARLVQSQYTRRNIRSDLVPGMPCSTIPFLVKTGLSSWARLETGTYCVASTLVFADYATHARAEHVPPKRDIGLF